MLGDPFRLTLREFDRQLAAIFKIEKWKRGEDSGPLAALDRDMERWAKGKD